MPKVIVKPAPAPGVDGRWALGIGMRQKFDANGKPVLDAQGNPTYWPARSGVFLPAGEDTELTITDQELKDLQTGANASLFMVQVVDPSAQPDVNEGGSSMANQPLNQPAAQQPTAPGSTVPPGTSPQPAPAPAPTPTNPAPTPSPDTTTRTSKK